MKIRLKGQTIRFRLSQREISSLATGDTVSEEIVFPNGPTMIWQVGAAEMLSDGTVSELVRTSTGGFRLNLQRNHLNELCDAGRRAVKLAWPCATSDKTLQVILEKDWASLKIRDGDGDHDSFTHPRRESGGLC